MLRLPALFLVSALAFGLPLAATAQPILYVDADASGADDGSSWTNAFEELDEALDAAESGAQIWVAEGVYYPTDDPERAESFFLKSGVAVYGGFTGTETSLDQRTADPDENGCVLSGDIGAEDDDSDNSYHVIIAAGVDDTAVLDGFLVTGGNADGEFPNKAAAASPTSAVAWRPDIRRSAMSPSRATAPASAAVCSSRLRRAKSCWKT